MKKVLLITIIVFICSSCAAPKLYYWGSSSSNDESKYEKLTYQNYDKQTPESICDLVCLYEDMVKNPGGTRNVVPPGIYAEYGYLLLQQNTADAFEKYATKKQRKTFTNSDYSNFFPEYGVLMMQKEIELYPESAIFITPLLKRLTDN